MTTAKVFYFNLKGLQPINSQWDNLNYRWSHGFGISNLSIDISIRVSSCNL